MYAASEQAVAAIQHGDSLMLQYSSAGHQLQVSAADPTVSLLPSLRHHSFHSLNHSLPPRSHRTLSLTCHSPQAAIIGGLASAIAGIAPPSQRHSREHGGSAGGDLLWSHGWTPFGPLGGSPTLSQVSSPPIPHDGVLGHQLPRSVMCVSRIQPRECSRLC